MNHTIQQNGSVTDTQETLPTKSNGKPNRIDIGEALKLFYVDNKGYAEIARHFGVHRVSVFQRLQPFIKDLPKKEQLDGYRGNRALFFDAIQAKIVKTVLTGDKITKANFGELSNAMERFYKLMRLETGQSTENVAKRVEVVPDAAIKKLDKLITPNE